MASKQFYLLGEEPSVTKHIEVSALIDEEDLRHLIASHFAIVDPQGMHFSHLPS
jgi:hypothetical protein